MAKIKILKDFRTFIERGSAIDMAVGIIVGSVLTGVVNSLVKDIITPPIGLLVGGVDFSQWFYVVGGGETGVHYNTIAAAQAAGATTVNVGMFLNSIISFLITMFAVFLFVRIVNKMRSKKPVTTHSCPYCKSMISNEAVKCPNCCSDVEPVETAPVGETDLQKGVKKLTEFATGIANKQVKKIKKITKR